jgi:hypothetical protein
MGINQYVKPQQQKEESDLDKVLKGLSVAKDVFGVYTDYKKLDEMKADRELKDAQTKEARAQFQEKNERDKAQELREQEKHDALKKTGFRTPKDPWVEEAQRTRIQDARDAKNNLQVEKLQAKLSPLQEIQNSVSTAENQMGFKLDQYDPETNKVNGEEVDLPGVSIPLLGRVTAHSNKARDLNTAMSRVFNVELKDRSGAAVTSPELQRLKQEFGEGKFNTEQEMLRAMKDYQRAATLAMKNVEAGYAPGAVDTYNERGGMTSRNLPNPSATSQASDGGASGGWGNEAHAAQGSYSLDDINNEIQKRSIKSKGLSGALPGKKK